MKTATRPDVYAQVTARIVEQLEAGVRPWFRPWNATHKAGSISRPLRNTGQPYQGVNVLVLWLTAFEKGYTCPIWLTFNQARDAGGCVKKGEKGTTVVYANTFEKKETDAATGEETTERIPFLKSYVVFNAEQVEGLPGHYYALAAEPKNLGERLAHAEAFFAATNADTRHGGNQAYYSPAGDFIQLPAFETFQSRESYYATRAHEAIHWTKHASRLNRDMGGKRFGDDGYAMEELIAELGSAFLAADLGLTPEVMPDHADYLACWLKVLKADKRAIFTAASQASKAAEYLHGLQPSETEETASAAGDMLATLDLSSSTPATDPDACYREMADAMDRYDLATARERSHALKVWLDLGGKYPQVNSRPEVDYRLRAVLARTVYPD